MHPQLNLIIVGVYYSFIVTLKKTHNRAQRSIPCIVHNIELTFVIILFHFM